MKVIESNREVLNRLKAQRRKEYLQRIPIEGRSGNGKNGYRLNYIRTKRADIPVAWINSIFLVMNLLILLRFFFRLCKGTLAIAVVVLSTMANRRLRPGWRWRPSAGGVIRFQPVETG